MSISRDDLALDARHDDLCRSVSRDLAMRCDAMRCDALDPTTTTTIGAAL